MSTRGPNASYFADPNEVPTIPATPSARLAYAAEALGVEMPGDLAPDLLADDGGPQVSVLNFCAAKGISLDFVYLGDVRPMLRARFVRKLDQNKLKARAASADAPEDVTEYLDGLQRMAVKARALLEAIGALGDEHDEEDALFEVIDAATRVVAKMDRELDEISRPASMAA